eukprot:284359-Rhodomonas_salina.1
MFRVLVLPLDLLGLAVRAHLLNKCERVRGLNVINGGLALLPSRALSAPDVAKHACRSEGGELTSSCLPSLRQSLHSQPSQSKPARKQTQYCRTHLDFLHLHSLLGSRGGWEASRCLEALCFPALFPSAVGGVDLPDIIEPVDSRLLSSSASA